MSDTRLGVMQRRKQYGRERVGRMKVWMPGAEARDSGSSFFVSTGVHERGVYVEEKGRVSRSLEG